jgi:hypothetical protein
MLSMTEKDRKFYEFHGENPHVLDELVRLARKAKELGNRRIGIRMLWEVMRWNFTVEVDSGDDIYTFNDHLTSRYSRMIMKRNADLVGMFRIRALRS